MTDSRPYAFVPGSATMRSTTSFCSMKCWSSIRWAKSARWNSSGLEMLYGRLPTTRSFFPSGTGMPPKSNFSASPAWIVRRSRGYAFSRRATRSRSSSTTCMWSSSLRISAVIAARPGPISTMVSPGRGSIDSMMLWRTWSSVRKFWPNRLRATCFMGLVRVIAVARAPWRGRRGSPLPCCRSRPGRALARPGPVPCRDRPTCGSGAGRA